MATEDPILELIASAIPVDPDDGTTIIGTRPLGPPLWGDPHIVAALIRDKLRDSTFALLPPGGEVSTHWLVLNVGGFWREDCPDEAAARDLFQRVCDINRGNGSTYEMRRRQVVTTPDGFKAKWPWEVVERSPVVSDNSEVPNAD